MIGARTRTPKIAILQIALTAVAMVMPAVVQAQDFPAAPPAGPLFESTLPAISISDQAASAPRFSAASPQSIGEGSSASEPAKPAIPDTVRPSDARSQSGGAPVASGIASDLDAGPPALIPAGDPSSLEFIGPPLVPPFAILDNEVLPGATARLEWSASQTFAGGAVVSPVTVVHGTRPGPVLCLTAAIHGDELNGVEIVRRTLNKIDPALLSGTVIGVPIVNLFGFSRNSRYLPDRRDLNRYFPGARFGSIASRIAHSFFENVVRHCDALVDFHTGSFDRNNLPQVRADLRKSEVLKFTRGFGATPVLHSDGARGMLRVAATAAGIPAVTFEVGAPMRLQPEEIRYGEQAIDTLMHAQGMTRDQPQWDQPQPIFYESVWVRSDAGGLLISEVELGERVERGSLLGHVIDPLNNIERKVLSPVNGTVLGMALNQVVLPGYATYHLGEETSEEGAILDAASGQSEAPIEEDVADTRAEESDPPMAESSDGAEFGDAAEFED